MTHIQGASPAPLSPELDGRSAASEARAAPPAERAQARAVVALVIGNLEFGGAERQVVELANHLDGEGFDAHVVSLSSYVPLAAFLRRRGSLHILERRYKYDAGVILRLAKLLRKLRADVVHGFMFDAEIASRLAGRIAGVRAIIGSERNADHHIPRLKRTLYRLTSGAMDLCIANSRAGAAFNGRVFGHSPSKYRVVYNGVDTNRFRPRVQSESRAALGVPRDAYCIGVFGSFKPQKNHLLFFAAARRLVADCPEAFFLVVGDSLEGGRRDSADYKRQVVKLIRDSDLESRCLFLGNREDVEELYCACDVTVLASLHEGTPNVALESMASRVPVVATDVGDNRRVIPDGEVGMIVPLADPDRLAAALLELARRPERRKAMGAAARSWTEERFSLERLAKETAQVYREVLARRA